MCVRVMYICLFVCAYIHKYVRNSSAPCCNMRCIHMLINICHSHICTYVCMHVHVCVFVCMCMQVPLMRNCNLLRFLPKRQLECREAISQCGSGEDGDDGNGGGGGSGVDGNGSARFTKYQTPKLPRRTAQHTHTRKSKCIAFNFT